MQEGERWIELAWRAVRRKILGTDHVTCWFCGHGQEVEPCSRNSFVCSESSCAQYNGWDENGDLNRSLPAQSDASLNNTYRTAHRSGPVASPESSSSDVLCRDCARSVRLWTKHLQSFEPTCAGGWEGEAVDEEISAYRARLEERHPLCEVCDLAVSSHLSKQNHAIRSRRLGSRLRRSTLERARLNFGGADHGQPATVFRSCSVGLLFFPALLALAAVAGLLLSALAELPVPALCTRDDADVTTTAFSTCAAAGSRPPPTGRCAHWADEGAEWWFAADAREAALCGRACVASVAERVWACGFPLHPRQVGAPLLEDGSGCWCLQVLAYGLVDVAPYAVALAVYMNVMAMLVGGKNLMGSLQVQNLFLWLLWLVVLSARLFLLASPTWPATAADGGGAQVLRTCEERYTSTGDFVGETCTEAPVAADSSATAARLDGIAGAWTEAADGVPGTVASGPAATCSAASLLLACACLVSQLAVLAVATLRRCSCRRRFRSAAASRLSAAHSPVSVSRPLLRGESGSPFRDHSPPLSPQPPLSAAGKSPRRRDERTRSPPRRSRGRPPLAADSSASPQLGIGHVRDSSSPERLEGGAVARRRRRDGSASTSTSAPPADAPLLSGLGGLNLGLGRSTRDELSDRGDGKSPAGAGPGGARAGDGTGGNDGSDGSRGRWTRLWRWCWPSAASRPSAASPVAASAGAATATPCPAVPAANGTGFSRAPTPSPCAASSAVARTADLRSATFRFDAASPAGTEAAAAASSAVFRRAGSGRSGGGEMRSSDYLRPSRINGLSMRLPDPQFEAVESKLAGVSLWAGDRGGRSLAPTRNNSGGSGFVLSTAATFLVNRVWAFASGLQWLFLTCLVKPAKRFFYEVDLGTSSTSGRVWRAILLLSVLFNLCLAFGIIAQVAYLSMTTTASLRQ